MTRYLILGAGRQGLAIAYDLSSNGGEVTLLDPDAAALRKGAARLRRLTGTRFDTITGKSTVARMRGHDVVVSAAPYRFNPALAEMAVRAGASFCDLGGNTSLVQQALKLDRRARAARVTIVPDCGLAPGLSNVLASIAIREVSNAKHVQIRCGGLPVEPRGPLKYGLLFDVSGLINEYSGDGVVLRNGKLRREPALTGLEPFRCKLGVLEAFVTSGGTSTAPWTYRGKLLTYEYKTVRYKGHCERIDFDALRKLPSAGRDLAILRVDCTDARGRGVRYQMLQYHDDETGFSAMEQTTGYAAAAIAEELPHMRPGAYTPERCGFGPEYVRALRKRGLSIRRRVL